MGGEKSWKDILIVHVINLTLFMSLLRNPQHSLLSNVESVTAAFTSDLALRKQYSNLIGQVKETIFTKIWNLKHIKALNLRIQLYLFPVYCYNHKTLFTLQAVTDDLSFLHRKDFHIEHCHLRLLLSKVNETAEPSHHYLLSNYDQVYELEDIFLNKNTYLKIKHDFYFFFNKMAENKVHKAKLSNKWD